MSHPRRDLLAINGLGGLEFLWDGFRAAIAPKHDLVVLDLPGHGDRKPLPDYHYAALVEDVVQQVESRRAFPLLGWSVGATVAWLVAARHPRLVTHLVLIEPAAPHLDRFRNGPIPEPVHSFTYASVDKAMAALAAIDSSITPQDVDRLYRRNAIGRLEPRFDPAIFPALVEDARDRGEELGLELSAVRCPVLVIRGEKSFISEAMARDVSGLAPRSRYVTVKGAGHFIVKERPVETAAIVADFLN